MLIDEYLKEFDFSEYHKIEVGGTPKDIYPLVLNAENGKSLIIKALFKWRGMATHSTCIKNIDKIGFIKLHELENEEILFGRITSSPTFSNCKSDITSDDFKALNSTGTIKAIINFCTTQLENNKTLISTETRVVCYGKITKNKFRMYWFFISPFSRLIRHLMLKQIEASIQKSSSKKNRVVSSELL